MTPWTYEGANAWSRELDGWYADVWRLSEGWWTWQVTGPGDVIHVYPVAKLRNEATAKGHAWKRLLSLRARTL